MITEKIFILLLGLEEILNTSITEKQLFKLFRSYDEKFSKKDLFHLLDNGEYLITNNSYIKISLNTISYDEMLDCDLIQIKKVQLIIE